MLSWYRRLDNAKSANEVLRIAQEYLASWDPQRLAKLPAGTQPGALQKPADIEALRTRIVDEYRGSTLSGEPLKALTELTSFVVRASVRLAEFAGDEPPKGGGDDAPRGTFESAPWRDYD